MRLALSLLLAASALLAPAPPAAAQAPPAAKPFVIEYYYKAKWGQLDEFLRLFRKNHLPVLMEEKKLGRIVDVALVKPVYHGTEEGRWDFRVTITWRDAATAHDAFDTTPILTKLYPDQDAFRKEEQRRFELLDAHWDLPIATVPPEK